MDYFDMVGQNVKRVLAAIERENEPCQAPDGLTGSRADAFKAEFAKKSEEIDGGAREALGAILTGIVCDLHIIAVSISDIAGQVDKEEALLETPAPK